MAHQSGSSSKMQAACARKRNHQCADEIKQPTPTLKCSDTSHDSNAEKRREVAMPHSTRPPHSTQKLFTCLVRQPSV